MRSLTMIWNCRERPDLERRNYRQPGSGLFCDFVGPGTIRASYAASLGNDTVPKEQFLVFQNICVIWTIFPCGRAERGLPSAPNG